MKNESLKEVVSMAKRRLTKPYRAMYDKEVARIGKAPAHVLTRRTRSAYDIFVFMQRKIEKGNRDMLASASIAKDKMKDMNLSNVFLVRIRYPSAIRRVSYSKALVKEIFRLGTPHPKLPA